MFYTNFDLMNTLHVAIISKHDQVDNQIHLFNMKVKKNRKAKGNPKKMGNTVIRHMTATVEVEFTGCKKTSTRKLLDC